MSCVSDLKMRQMILVEVTAVRIVAQDKMFLKTLKYFHCIKNLQVA